MELRPNKSMTMLGRWLLHTRAFKVNQCLGVKVGNLVSQDNLVIQTGIFKVNLHLVDKADNLVNMDNLVLHKDNLERDGAG